MLLTGHKSRAIFDRYNIINEQELLDAGDQLVAYLAQQAQAVPARRRSHTAGAAAPRTCGWRIRKNSIYRSIFMSREPEPSAKFSRWRA